MGPESSGGGLVSKVAHELEARHIRVALVTAGIFRQNELLPETQMLTVPHEAARDAGGSWDKRRTRGSKVTFWEDRSSEGARRHSISGFSRRVEELLRDHDLILVNAPPLLLSADTEYLVTQPAATFLTVEAGRVSKQDLQRAATLMERLRPAGIAAILHNVSLKSSDWPLRRSFREFEAGRTRI